MTTAKAIAMLREKLGLTQEQFAKQLGVSLFSVSRYEGGRTPSRETMRKLALFAAERADKLKINLDDIREFFERARKIDIKSGYRKRPSAGTGRHVPLPDLRQWADRLVSISDCIADAMYEEGFDRKAAALMNAHVTADFLRNDIRLYIGGEDPMHSMSGLREHDQNRDRDKYLRRLYMKAWEKREFGDS